MQTALNSIKEFSKEFEWIRILNTFSKTTLNTSLLFIKLSSLSPCNQLVQLLRLVNFTVFYLGPLLIAYMALQADLAIQKSQ
jgi:hypothetical protein